MAAAGIRLDGVRVRPVAMKVGHLEEEQTAEPLIPGDGLDDALRNLQRAIHDMGEGDGGPDGRAVGSEPADTLGVVLREGADVQRRAFRELAEASAENSPAFRQQAHRDARPRRIVHALDHPILIGTEAQLDIQPIVEAPAILSEDGDFSAADFRVRHRRGVGRSLGQRPIQPDDVELLTVVLAVEP